jgi:hypothetical protein
MSTRSTIGYETADGGYVGVYCHYAIVISETERYHVEEEVKSLCCLWC